MLEQTRRNAAVNRAFLHQRVRRWRRHRLPCPQPDRITGPRQTHLHGGGQHGVARFGNRSRIQHATKQDIAVVFVEPHQRSVIVKQVVAAFKFTDRIDVIDAHILRVRAVDGGGSHDVSLRFIDLILQSKNSTQRPVGPTPVQRLVTGG